MKTGVIFHYILDSLGLDEQAIKIIMIIYFIAIIVLVIGIISSILNTAKYTKKLTEQNEKIIKELQMIRLASVEKVNLEYMKYEDETTEMNTTQQQ